MKKTSANSWLLCLLICITFSAKVHADTEFTFAYQDRIADAASIIAIDQGYFSELGMPLKALRFSSGTAVSEAVYSGSADIGTMGDSAALIMLARNQHLSILASHGGGEKRHRIVTRKGLHLEHPADLIGHSIAIKKGTSTYGGLLAYLQAHDLKDSQVKLIDMRPVDMATALATGTVDAICASEPTPSLAELQGGNSFTDLAGLGNEYPIMLVARSAYIDQQPVVTHKFLLAIAKAIDFINSNTKQAAQIVARRTGLSPVLTSQAMQKHVYALRLDEDILSSLEKTGQMLITAGKIPALPDLKKRSVPLLLSTNSR